MHKRAHVLSLIGSLGFGGAENRLLSIAQNIDHDRFRHQVAVLSDLHDHEEAVAMLRQYTQSGVEVLQIPEWRGGKISRFIRRIRSLCEILKGREIDLIDCHCESASLLGAVAGVLTGRRSIATLYHPDPILPVRFWYVAKQFILTQSHMIVSDSAVRATEIQNAAYIKRPNVAVIPNGISVPRSSCTRDDMLRQLKIPDEKNLRIIGQISALREFKGQCILLDAAKLVIRAYPSAFFLLAGYEKDAPGFQKQLEQRAHQLGIADRVRIGGYPGPIGDVWQIIDVHAHASLFDSLPNAIIEGMALAKPAVVTSVGGIPEAVVHEETGLVVPPGDALSLASGLLRMLRDTTLADHMGKAASRRYTALYGPDLFIRRIESCFLQVIYGCSTPHQFQKSSATTLSL
jgi:glycosyltransferase involved in cell wall biosynthesis